MINGLNFGNTGKVAASLDAISSAVDLGNAGFPEIKGKISDEICKRRIANMFNFVEVFEKYNTEVEEVNVRSKELGKSTKNLKEIVQNEFENVNSYVSILKDTKKGEVAMGSTKSPHVAKFVFSNQEKKLLKLQIGAPIPDKFFDTYTRLQISITEVREFSLDHVEELVTVSSNLAGLHNIVLNKICEYICHSLNQGTSFLGNADLFRKSDPETRLLHILLEADDDTLTAEVIQSFIQARSNHIRSKLGNNARRGGQRIKAILSHVHQILANETDFYTQLFANKPISEINLKVSSLIAGSVHELLSLNLNTSEGEIDIFESANVVHFYSLAFDHVMGLTGSTNALNQMMMSFIQDLMKLFLDVLKIETDNMLNYANDNGIRRRIQVIESILRIYSRNLTDGFANASNLDAEFELFNLDLVLSKLISPILKTVQKVSKKSTNDQMRRAALSVNYLGELIKILKRFPVCSDFIESLTNETLKFTEYMTAHKLSQISLDCENEETLINLVQELDMSDVNAIENTIIRNVVKDDLVISVHNKFRPKFKDLTLEKISMELRL